MRVSGIAREYSTLLFSALDIALNYSLISLFTALSLAISCYRSLSHISFFTAFKIQKAKSKKPTTQELV
jgi:hypothetical protein